MSRARDTRLGRWLRYWNGRWRLRWLFCPACYSSPPRDDCTICRGTREYGPGMPDIVLGMWRRRWDRAHGR